MAGQRRHSLFRRELGPFNAEQDFLVKETTGIGPNFELMGLVNTWYWLHLLTIVETTNSLI